MIISRERFEAILIEERQKIREEVGQEIFELFQTRFEAQEKCIKAAESENRLLKDFLKELGAEVDEKITPLAKVSSNPSDPTETKFVTISFERRFITWDFKRRLTEINRELKQGR